MTSWLLEVHDIVFSESYVKMESSTNGVAGKLSDEAAHKYPIVTLNVVVADMVP